MAEDKKGAYEVGFGKPPRSTKFKPGQSGNSKGRPKGAKNFATALEEELNASVPITENGKRRKIAKRQVIAKLLVNKAATGDLRAIPLLLNETRIQEGHFADATPDEIFDTAEDQKVIDSILNRHRQSDQESPGMVSSTQPKDQADPGEIPRSPQASK
jgi:hypothetical protein